MVSQAEFARMAGVKPPSVSGAIAAGRVVKESDGRINPRRAENALYLTTAKRQRRKPGGKKAPAKPQRQQRGHRGRRKRSDPGDEDSGVGAPAGPLSIDGETYGEAELRKIIAQANKEEQAVAIRRGELVERSDVHRVFARLYQVHTSQLKTLADKLGPDIAAAFKLTDADTPRVQELMGLEVRRSLAQIKKEMNEYLDAIGDGEVADAEV